MPKKKNQGGVKNQGAATSESGSSTANVSGSSTANVSGVSTPRDNAEGGLAASVANVESSATSTTPDPTASTALDLTTSTPLDPITSTPLEPTTFTALNPTIFTPLNPTTSSTDYPTTPAPPDFIPKKKKKRDRPRHGPGKNRQAEILARAQEAALLAGGQHASSSGVSTTAGSATVEDDPNQSLALQVGATHETHPVLPSRGFSFTLSSTKGEDDPSTRLAIESSALEMALRESTELKQILAQLGGEFEESKRQWEETELSFDKIAEEFDEKIQALEVEVEEEKKKGKEKTQELEHSRTGFEMLLQQKEEKCVNEKMSMKKRQDTERAAWDEITKLTSVAMKKLGEECGEEKAALKRLLALEEADNKLAREEIRRGQRATKQEQDNASALRKELIAKEKKWKEIYDQDLTSARVKGDESARKVLELEEALRKCHKDREEAKKNAPDMDEFATTTVLKKKIDELQAECHKYWGQLQQFQSDFRSHDDEIRKLKDEIAAKNIIMSDLEVAVAKNEKEARAAKIALTEAQRSVADIEAERKESNRNFDDIIRNQELGISTIESQKAEIESLQLKTQQLEGEVAAKDQSMQRLVAELNGLNTQVDDLISARNQHDRQKLPDAPYSHLDPEDYDVPRNIREKREDRQESSLGTELENLDVLSSSDDELERDAKVQGLLGQVSSLKNDLQAALAGGPELEASKAAIRDLESDAAAAHIQLVGYETRIQELEDILASRKSEGRSYLSGGNSQDRRIEELESEIASLKVTAEEPRLKMDSLVTERDTLKARITYLQNELLQQPGSNSEQPVVTVANIDPLAPSNLPSADYQPVQLVIHPIVTVADIPATSAVEDPAVPGPISPAIKYGHNAAIFNWTFNPFKAWWRVYLSLYIFLIRLLNLCLPNVWQLNEPFPPIQHFHIRDAVQSRMNTPGEVHTMIVEPPNLMLNILMLFCHGVIYYLLCNYVLDINYLRDERKLWLQANDLTRQMLISLRSTGDLGYGIRWLDKLAFDLHVRSGFDRSFPG